MAGNLVRGRRAGDWVAARIDGGFFAERSEALAYERGGEIVAGVIYESFNGASVLCHIAVEGRMPPWFVAAIFHYPFKVQRVGKIICPVAQGNEASRRLAENFGFREEARIEAAHPTGYVSFYTLTPEACRFLSERYMSRLVVPA